MENEVVRELIVASCFSTLAIAIALASRTALRALFGSTVAYWFWLVVPVVLLAELLPVHAGTANYLSFVGTDLGLPQHAGTFIGPHESLAVTIALCTWASGACSMLLLLLWQQARFARGLTIVARRSGVLYARSVLGGPLVIGIVRPQIVVPVDFDERYTPTEQQVVMAHERMHMRRGDPIANAICAFLRCAFWFNPLVHVAAGRFRFDQELACDEEVIRHNPVSRQSYANAMLKTHLRSAEVPLACHWPSRHPLRARIMMLKKAQLSRGRRAWGSLITGLAVIAIGYGAWAAQPGSGTPSSAQSNRSRADSSSPGGIGDRKSALLAHADAGAGACSWVILQAYRDNVVRGRRIGRRMAVLAVGPVALHERTDEPVALIFVCVRGPEKVHSPLLLTV